MSEILTEVWTTLWSGESSIAEFGHLMEMAFGCALAYAALIRAGKLQGDHLEHYCMMRHEEVTLARKLLTVENLPILADMSFDANKVRCQSHATEFQRKISISTNRFSVAAIFVAASCVLALLVAGIWEPKLPNIIIVGLVVLAFAPVPIGLGRTMYLVKQAETEISKEYEDFFVAVNLIREKLKEETNKALQEINSRRKRKQPNFLSRWIFFAGDDK